MKKIAALGLAALMAVGATVASSQAFAKDWPNNNNWPNKQYWKYKNHHPHSGFFLSGPLFFGLTFGPRYLNPYPYPYQYQSLSSLHVQWCSIHYKTYNPYTNLFFIKKGVPAVCVSPYWHG
jgi:hypothetical protein